MDLGATYIDFECQSRCGCPKFDDVTSRAAARERWSAAFADYHGDLHNLFETGCLDESLAEVCAAAAEEHSLNAVAAEAAGDGYSADDPVALATAGNGALVALQPALTLALEAYENALNVNALATNAVAGSSTGATNFGETVMVRFSDSVNGVSSQATTISAVTG